jgi:putative ABC transport system permease protein
MSFKTALALSIKNLFSKRTRTILTSIAGSIGIIGVALVLALSNGFDGYMARMQTDTLATYPVTISESSVDLSSFTEIYESETKEKFPELDTILVEKAFKNLTGMLVSNNLSDTSEKGFLHYIEQTDKNLYYDIAYDYAFDMNDYFFTNIRIGSPDPTDPTKTIYNPNFMAIDTLVGQIESMFNEQLNAAVGLNTDFVRQYIPTIQEMPNSNELILEQYDIIDGGHLPTKPEEIVLVVDEYNGINDISLALLGFLGVTFNPAGDINNAVIFEGKDTISLEEVIGKEIYLANNDVMFSEDGGEYFANKVEPTTTGLEKLKVVGILRPKENSNGILTTGFAYHPSLTEKVLEDNKTSQIVTAIKSGTFLPAADGEHKGQFVIYANVYNPKLGATIKTPIDYLSLRGIAGNVLTPAKISIYAKDFDSKEQIKAYMDEWNDKVVYQNYATEDEQERCKITYSDMMSMMFGMLGTMVDAVTYVLVAITSISHIGSSVMIGIITYISVVERTKEIGVLRALGASKREISRVFNAETFLIGLFAGTLGVVVTYILSLPINLLMSSLVPSVGNIAILNPFAALALIGVSICLTLVAGLIPSRAAAKKDPVVALRTE